jgi:hypothetical protein
MVPYHFTQDDFAVPAEIGPGAGRRTEPQRAGVWDLFGAALPKFRE